MDNSEDKDSFQRTGEKMQMKQDPLVESKYEVNEQAKGEDDRNSRLDQIEAEIREHAKRLEEIQNEQIRDGDKYSERYLELEQERTQIKKRIIDLDFQHRTELATSVRESRRREAEEKERILKEAEEQRERRKKELEERLKGYELERSRRKQEPQTPKENQAEDSQKQEREPEPEKKDVQEEDEERLNRSRRQLRIAEIEQQLAEASLRRSRISSLNAELEYLRATYSYPYYPPPPLSYYPLGYYPSYLSYPYTPPYPYSSLYRYRWY